MQVDRVRALQEEDEEAPEPWVKQYVQMIARSRGFWKSLSAHNASPFR